MTKIIIASELHSKRLWIQSHFQKYFPNDDFILVRSFQDIFDELGKSEAELIILDSLVEDPRMHRTREDAISTLRGMFGKQIIIIDSETERARKAIEAGADLFIPIHYLPDLSKELVVEHGEY